MKKHHLIPAPGRKVRLPETGEVMPARGMEVAVTAYWQRRIDDGDVQIAVPHTPKPSAAAPEAAPKKGKE